MAMLHTVNKSPFEKTSFDSCLRLAQAGSAILLIEDAVYAAMKGTSAEEKLRSSMRQFEFYALEPDLKARGLDSSNCIESIELVDYDGFVDLVAEHDNVQAWL